MAQPLERTIQRELHLTTEQINSDLDLAPDRVQEHDARTKNMGFLERLWTYRERRIDRLQLIKEVDYEAGRLGAALDIGKAVDFALVIHRQALEREQAPEPEPVREKSPELEPGVAKTTST